MTDTNTPRTWWMANDKDGWDSCPAPSEGSPQDLAARSGELQPGDIYEDNYGRRWYYETEA